MMQQYTIKHPIPFEGIGLHSGIAIQAMLLPAAINTGIQFQRIDLPGQPIIQAALAQVVATERATTIGKDDVQVTTIEHLLAAIAGLQLDNICIQLNGPEVPDLDGCALGFVQLLETALLPQEAPKKFYTLKEKFTYSDPHTGSYFEIYPDDSYRLHCTLAYERWPLSYQYATLDGLDHFANEIAPARTFCYLDEIVQLYQKGLIQGGDPTKGLVFYEHSNSKELLDIVTQLSGKNIDKLVTPLSQATLRYSNEPARHKLLDLIGDLALLGRPLQGKIFAHKPGHGANIGFAHALQKLWLKQESKGAPICNTDGPSLLDSKQIQKILPHRYPFQLVDKIIQIDSTSIIGIKNVTINEPFFQGHFPNMPIMPGVLQVEALAQTSGLLVLHKLEDPENYLTYFLSIDRCKFRRMVVPGDTLILHCQLRTPIRFSTTQQQSIAIAQIEGRVFVGKNLTCEARLLAQIVKQYEQSVN